MNKYYVTFGQAHTHSHNEKTLDKDCVGVIYASDYMHARTIIVNFFGRQWSHMYEEHEIGADFMDFFSRGLIDLN